MQPILISWQGVIVWAFGFFAMLGFVAASFYLWKQSRQLGWQEEKTMDKFVLTVLWGLIFARLVNVLTYQSRYSGWGEVINLVGKPGLSWWGGWLGAGLALWFLTRREVRQRAKYFDVFSLAAGWLGLFMSLGCSINACVATRALPPVLTSSWPVWLTPEFLVGGYLVLTSGMVLAVLYRVSGRYKTYRWYGSKKDGFVIGVFVLLSVVQKSLLEIAVLDRLYWRGVNVNWLMSGMVAVIAVGYIGVLSGLLPDWRQLKELIVSWRKKYETKFSKFTKS